MSISQLILIIVKITSRQQFSTAQKNLLAFTTIYKCINVLNTQIRGLIFGILDVRNIYFSGSLVSLRNGFVLGTNIWISVFR